MSIPRFLQRGGGLSPPLGLPVSLTFPKPQRGRPFSPTSISLLPSLLTLFSVTLPQCFIHLCPLGFINSPSTSSLPFHEIYDSRLSAGPPVIAPCHPFSLPQISALTEVSLLFPLECVHFALNQVFPIVVIYFCTYIALHVIS